MTIILNEDYEEEDNDDDAKEEDEDDEEDDDTGIKIKREQRDQKLKIINTGVGMQW